MPAPPSQADLEALAERALAHVAGEGQATAWWERGADNSGGGLRCWDAVRVEVAALGGGVVQTDAVSDDGLRAAATAAARLAPGPRRAPRALPDPAPGRTHDGYDPAAAMDAAQAAEAIAALPPASSWRTAAAKIAIASTRGVRAYEQRSQAELTLLQVGGRQAFIRAAATAPSGLDAAALAADFARAGGRRAGRRAPPGERAVVLGPWAVAALLEDAAWQFGAAAASRFADSLGKRIVAPCINLSDSPRFARTLPRSYDAEGAPVSPVPLIQDGVAHRVVHDATTAAQAGVATTGRTPAPGSRGRATSCSSAAARRTSPSWPRASRTAC